LPDTVFRTKNNYQKKAIGHFLRIHVVIGGGFTSLVAARRLAEILSDSRSGTALKSLTFAPIIGVGRA